MLSRTIGAAFVFTSIFTAACALGTRSIADIQHAPGRYQDRSVSIEGTVTSSFGGPFVPVNYYKVDDGTGEITVLSRGGNRTPSRGSHVQVKGVVRDVAMFNGMPLGLHLEERDLDIRRN